MKQLKLKVYGAHVNFELHGIWDEVNKFSFREYVNNKWNNKGIVITVYTFCKWLSKVYYFYVVLYVTSNRIIKVK